MENRSEIKVTREMFNNTEINDEYLFRELAIKIVDEIPLDELHKLFKLTKIDPHSDESQKVLRDSRDIFEIEQIMELRRQHVILYQAKLDIHTVLRQSDSNCAVLQSKT